MFQGLLLYKFLGKRDQWSCHITSLCVNNCLEPELSHLIRYYTYKVLKPRNLTLPAEASAHWPWISDYIETCGSTLTCCQAPLIYHKQSRWTNYCFQTWSYVESAKIKPIASYCLYPSGRERFSIAEHDKHPILEQTLLTGAAQSLGRWSRSNFSLRHFEYSAPYGSGLRACSRWSEYKVVRYLPPAFLSFQYHGYVQSAKGLVPSNAIRCLKVLDITYKSTISVVSLNNSFNSYRRLYMEFTNAKIRTILKFPFA